MLCCQASLLHRQVPALSMDQCVVRSIGTARHRFAVHLAVHVPRCPCWVMQAQYSRCDIVGLETGMSDDAASQSDKLV